VEGLVGHLLCKGATVHLAYSGHRACADLPRLVRRVEDAGGRTLDLKVGNAPRPRDTWALLALHRFVRSCGADVIHAHSSKAGALARALPMLGIRQPVFYSPHAYYGMTRNRGIKTWFFNSVERALKPFAATVNTSPSEAEFGFRQLHVQPGSQITILNGVDTNRFVAATPETRTQAREKLHIPQNAVVIGTVSRVSEQKDPLTLYQAFSRVARGRKDLFLYHLGGSGPTELEDQLTSVVTRHQLRKQFRRERFHSDMPLVYSALDAVVLPSIYEGLSLVLLEAMAANVPLVLSTGPGNIDMKKEGLNRAWWCAPGDTAAFAEAIADCARTSRVGCNHREIALARFSQAVCYDTLMDCYRAALQQGSPAIATTPLPKEATFAG
jgi:glycosyltransferase involved in cell wall biosynthesis